MGNHNLRKQVGILLKKNNLGKLYTGKRRHAFRMRARELRRLIFLLSLKPGDLVNDCDYFNHRFKSIPKTFRDYRGRIKIDQILFEDGKFSCGCPYGPQEPWPKEDIEKVMRAIHEDEPEFLSESVRKRIENGFPVCDEHGCRIGSE